MDSFKRIGKVTNALLPNAPGRRCFATALKKFPIADGGSVGYGSGQLDLGACEDCFEMVEGPFVVGQQAKVGLNVVHCELTGRLIRFGDGPCQSASPEPQGIDLKLKFAEGFVIELHLDLGNFEFRAEGFIGTAEPHVFCDDSLVPSQSQSGELEIDTALAQFFQERPF
jgi:hypothetical protein